MPIWYEICPKNPVIEPFLLCPISKISPIWAYFETEPDAGFFWIHKWAIGAQIEPGWGWVELHPGKKSGGGSTLIRA
jgi:hypothetical protein